MAKIGICLICFALIGCSSPQVMQQTLTYDYLIAPSYPLTDKHKTITVIIDDTSLKRPEPALSYEQLKLKYTANKNADVVVFLHFLPSFLVQRSPISQQVIEYDENDKGTVVYRVTNRGFIRTPYSVEVVDNLNETLIFQTQGAGNFAIDAIPKPELAQTESALTSKFYEQRQAARETLLHELWQQLKGRLLKDIQMNFAKMEFRLVKDHELEGDFARAYLLLEKNDKAAAKQALNIYNNLLKRYEKKEGEENQAIARYANDGITAATQIVNDPHPQRFSNK
ncbi:MAG: hypothetical protein HWE18_04915 [Gammaproteobacteria bacterium]|nr:hypothetical protein [Gammaproteobacteria bacterium]